MKKFISDTKILALLCLFATTFVSSAVAFPGRGGSCTNCHDDGSGALTLSSNPLDVIAGVNKLLTIDVTSLGAMDPARVAVEGLDDPLLDFAFGPGGDTWTFRSGSSGTSYQTGDLSSPGIHTLAFLLGSGATPGTYPITVYLSGSGPSGLATVFNLNVIGIPEPATGALLVARALGVVMGRSRNRRDALRNRPGPASS